MKEKVKRVRDFVKPHIQECFLASVLIVGVIAGVWIVYRF